MDPRRTLRRHSHVWLLAASLFIGQPAQMQSRGLTIVIVDGEDAVNIIQQNTAVVPVVEVRDRNNVPIAGAAVTFSIRGKSATFASGGNSVTMVTDAAGRAAAVGLAPTTAGPVSISVSATFQGETAALTISQSNVITAADAARAVRNPGAGSGAAVGKITAIIGGIAAAGGAIAVAGRSSTPSTSTGQPSLTATSGPAPPLAAPTPAPPSNRAPVVGSATATPEVALVGTDTPIAFQVQATDADDDQLTYFWEFPDGSSSDQRAFSRIFLHGGRYEIRITVSDGKTSASATVSLNMKTVTGTWSSGSNVTFDLTQHGTAVNGFYRSSYRLSNGDPFHFNCPVSGNLRSGQPQFILDLPHCPLNNGVGGYVPAIHYELNVSPDIDTLAGTLRQVAEGRLITGSVTLRRQ